MKKISIRFLIGLASDSDHAAWSGQTTLAIREGRRLGALAYLGKIYPFGGAFSGTGYWHGRAEPSLQYETIVDDYPRERLGARAVAENLAGMLAQEAIGLVFTPVEFHMIEHPKTPNPDALTVHQDEARAEYERFAREDSSS